MPIERFEPKSAPLNQDAYEALVPDHTKSFEEHVATFRHVHPNAKEFIILTQDGLSLGQGRAEVKKFFIEKTQEDSVYAGIDGYAPLMNGRLIDPNDRNAARFYRSFYATTHKYWSTLIQNHDDNPIKHAVVKSRDTGRPAFAVFDRSKLSPLQGDMESRGEANTSWTPRGDETTDTALRALYHVMSLR